jgi:hypothetical protein
MELQLSGGPRGEAPREVRVNVAAPLTLTGIRTILGASPALGFNVGAVTLGHDVRFTPDDAGPSADGVSGVIAVNVIDGTFETTPPIRVDPSLFAVFGIAPPIASASPRPRPPAVVAREEGFEVSATLTDRNGDVALVRVTTPIDPSAMFVGDLVALVLRLGSAMQFTPAPGSEDGHGTITVQAGDRQLAVGPAHFNADTLRRLGLAPATV